MKEEKRGWKEEVLDPEPLAPGEPWIDLIWILGSVGLMIFLIWRFG